MVAWQSKKDKALFTFEANLPRDSELSLLSQIIVQLDNLVEVVVVGADVPSFAKQPEYVHSQLTLCEHHVSDGASGRAGHPHLAVDQALSPSGQRQGDKLVCAAQVGQDFDIGVVPQLQSLVLDPRALVEGGCQVNEAVICPNPLCCVENVGDAHLAEKLDVSGRRLVTDEDVGIHLVTVDSPGSRHH